MVLRLLAFSGINVTTVDPHTLGAQLRGLGCHTPAALRGKGTRKKVHPLCGRGLGLAICCLNAVCGLSPVWQGVGCLVSLRCAPVGSSPVWLGFGGVPAVGDFLTGFIPHLAETWPPAWVD